MYLKMYLVNAVYLEYTDNTACFKVKMKMGKGKSKNAIITSGWSKAMQTYKSKEGSICLFEFFITRSGKIGLMIHKMPEHYDSSKSSEPSYMSKSSEPSESSE
jgi:hypothetical protein